MGDQRKEDPILKPAEVGRLLEFLQEAPDTMEGEHLTEGDLASYGEGNGGEADVKWMDRHLASCEKCAIRMEQRLIVPAGEGGNTSFDLFIAKMEPRVKQPLTPVNAPPTLRVLIVDGHQVVREGLRTIIDRQPDMVVVAEASDGDQAVALFDRYRPDLTLMELGLPTKSGVDAIAEIRNRYPRARIIVFTDYDGDEDIHRALKAGAKSYLLKSVSYEELLSTMRAVAVGGRPLSPAVAERLAQHFEGSNLTRRELEVLGLIVAGKSNKRIAATLGVCEGTIKTHVNRILAKLGVDDRTQAAIQALQRGIVRPD